VYLKRLEIQGFKTFAPRTVLDFRPGITAVVGPNGSGKSNIADAVRWVLGEQSYASLRSKKLEDLIFSGGSKRAPSGFAEVSLTIDNSDRLLPLPYNEVTITRRATRSGESEYSINRQRVRLRDIHEAIGPLGGSYTIINQGLVDAALTLRPEERRRLFEDAAEISSFESRKNDAERRLRETDANLERCADMLTEIEPRLRSLKRQATLARSHRELSDELRVLLRQHYQNLWRETLALLAQAEAEQNQHEQELARRRQAQAQASTQVRQIREQLRTLRERLGTLHAESSALHTKAEAVQRELAVGNERQAALARRAEEFERSQQDLALRREELEREQAVVAERLRDAEARLAEQRASLAQAEEAQRAQAAVRRQARQALEQAQRAEAEANAALGALARRVEQLGRRRTQLLEAQQSQSDKLGSAQQRLDQEQARYDAAQTQTQAIEQQRNQAIAQAEQARSELEALRTERSRADEAVAKARRSLADLEARFETLNQLQRDFAGTFAGVRAAMQWAEREKRSGFVLVSSIVRTPAQLETAIEVTLGARLQNIVVERWADADAAIAALKRGGQGRATFLPLDNLRVNQNDRRPQFNSRSVLGVAAELVDFDPHYQIVVNYLLGRTLIVEDLDTAREQLRQLSGGWQIVTLGGEQVSSGGALTGGAQVKETGTLRRERELREFPDQIAKQRTVFEQAVAARAALDAQLQAAEKRLQDAENSRRQLTRDRDSARDTQEAVRRALEQARADLEWQRRHQAQAEADMADLVEQEHHAEEERASLQTRLHEATLQLEALRGDEQATLAAEAQAQQELDAQRANLAATDGEARAERALLQSQQHNLRRLDEQRENELRRAAEHQQQHKELLAQLEQLDQSHVGLLAQIDALRALIGPAEQELVALEQQQTESEQAESVATAALLEGEATYNRAALEVQRAQSRRDAVWERAATDDIEVESLAEQEIEQTLPSEQLQQQIDQLKNRIQRLGPVNPLALEEYEEAAQRYEFLSTQTADLRQAESSLRELIAELDAAMRSRFEQTFVAVAEEFERTFVRLFGGGQAQLQLLTPNNNGNGHESVDSLGVEILVRPPGKRQQTLSLLSGGERSLTAAALLFAILKVNPSPFCVLDEVDAALDESNVGRFRNALMDLADQTQFMLVTHNRGTIEAADTIYGVSMGDDGASRVLSLRLDELVNDD
jgi:chromosome segregation protein